MRYYTLDHDGSTRKLKDPIWFRYLLSNISPSYARSIDHGNIAGGFDITVPVNEEWKHVISIIREFSDLRMGKDQSAEPYSEKGNSTINGHPIPIEKVHGDILLGAIGEFMTYFILRDRFDLHPSCIPDLDIYSRRDKGFDKVDINGLGYSWCCDVHVKTTRKSEYYVPSWVFETSDKLFYVNKENEDKNLISLVSIEDNKTDELVMATIVSLVRWGRIVDKFKELRNKNPTKRAIYLCDIPTASLCYNMESSIY
jgi:hypothetical protein